MRAAAGAGAGTRRRQHATRLASRPPLRKRVDCAKREEEQLFFPTPLPEPLLWPRPRVRPNQRSAGSASSARTARSSEVSLAFSARRTECFFFSASASVQRFTSFTVSGDSGESDDDDDAAEQPTQVPSSHEAQRMIQSLRDFIFAKDLPLSYVEQLDALEKDVRQLRVKQSKLTDYGFSANE